MIGCTVNFYHCISATNRSSNALIVPDGRTHLKNVFFFEIGSNCSPFEKQGGMKLGRMNEHSEN